MSQEVEDILSLEHELLSPCARHTFPSSSLCRISSIKGVYANPYGELTSFLPVSDNLYRQDSPQGCGNTCCTCHARAVCACSRYYDARHVPNLQHICSGLLLEDIWSLGLHRHGMPASSWGFVLRILLLALCHVVRSAAQPSEPLPLAVPSGQAPLGYAGTRLGQQYRHCRFQS